MLPPWRPQPCWAWHLLATSDPLSWGLGQLLSSLRSGLCPGHTASWMPDMQAAAVLPASEAWGRFANDAGFGKKHCSCLDISNQEENEPGTQMDQSWVCTRTHCRRLCQGRCWPRCPAAISIPCTCLAAVPYAHTMHYSLGRQPSRSPNWQQPRRGTHKPSGGPFFQ